MSKPIKITKRVSFALDGTRHALLEILRPHNSISYRYSIEISFGGNDSPFPFYTDKFYTLSVAEKVFDSLLEKHNAIGIGMGKNTQVRS